MSSYERLGNYVRRIMNEKGLSIYDVSRHAGGRISKSYVCSIANGKVGALTVAKLSALAYGLGVSEDEIFSVARGAEPKNDKRFQESEFAILFYKYSELSDNDKSEVIILLDLVDREIDRRQARKNSNPFLNREGREEYNKTS